MNFVSDVLKEILFFFNEVSIYLLFGFIMAGVLHVLFPESIIRHHLGLGYLLNILAARYGFHRIILLHQHEMLPGWLKVFGSIMLALMLGWYYLETKILNRTGREKDMGDNKICLDVQGMTCMHCAGNVKKAVESITGISNISVDLDGKRVSFEAKEGGDIEKVKGAIVGAGYSA